MTKINVSFHTSQSFSFHMGQLVIIAATASVLCCVQVIALKKQPNEGRKETTKQCWPSPSYIISLPFPHNPISFTADVSNADGEIQHIHPRHAFNSSICSELISGAVKGLFLCRHYLSLLLILLSYYET